MTDILENGGGVMMYQAKRVVICILALFLAANMAPIPQAAAAEIPPITWPGEKAVTVCDPDPVFYGNASGLDFHDGRLYAVDNGGGFLWVLEAFPEGSLRPADGYATGKALQYADRESVYGPDVEGVTVDGAGLVYLAAERDNDRAWLTENCILQIDPWEASDPLRALRQWDLTPALPQAPANKGIEAVEWVGAEHLRGKLTDDNTGEPFDMARYPDAVSSGLFFVILEADDQIYAFVLNHDGTAVRIARLDPMLHGISALEFDPAEQALWAAADDRGENRMVKFLFSRTGVERVRILPPAGVDPRQNTEGFAIADEALTRNDRRPVYRLQDGVYESALTVGFLDWHVHEFSEDWLTDGQGHWHACRCGETSAEESHKFICRITETARKSGTEGRGMAWYHPSCEICGYLDIERGFAVAADLFPEIGDTPLTQHLYGIPCV